MARQKSFSVATKLTRMNMLVSASALLLACAAFIFYDIGAFRDSVVRNLSMQSQVAGSNSISALVFNDPPAAEKTLSAFKAAPSMVAARIYDAEGKPFATYQRDAKFDLPASMHLAAEQAENHWFGHDDVIVVHEIVFNHTRIGYIYMESDLQQLFQRLQSYGLIVLIVLVASLAAALAISRAVRNSIADPIRSVAELAQGIASNKDYSARARADGQMAELKILIEAFNEMISQIEQRDRSLRKAHDELELRVEQRTSELAAAIKELESFSYSVSHDLRAPLRSIDGFSLALAEDYGDKLDAQGKNHIERVRAATQRMGMLIDDMLNLSRVTRAEMRRERVDLSAMAQSVASELRKTDERRRVEWVIADGLEATGDPRLLRVVLDNLMGNAWKYTSKHPQARIEFGKAAQNGGFAYFVKDDGAGFDAQYSQRLFGAFQRLHGMNEFPGTGVGLATVQRIVNRHGGKVWAEAAVEKGATFYFSL